MANDKTYDRHINIWINGKSVSNDISSIKKEMFNLTNEVGRTTRGTEEYNQKAAELSRVKGILTEHQQSIRATGSAWDTIKNAAGGALGKILTIGGAATGAIALIKQGIESTEGSADKLREVMGLLTGGLQGFFHTALSGDWANIIKNISSTAKATKELVAARNELEHIEAGNYNALAKLELKKNEAIINANESRDAAERKKYFGEAINYQKQITAINIEELTKRSGLSADYYRKLAGQDKDYFDALLKRVPEIAENYEMQFALLDGYKARLAELNSLQQMQVGGLTAAQEKERHYYQLLVYNLEDYLTLQDDLSKPGQWDEFVKSLGAITMGAADGEAALKRLTKQFTSADQAVENSAKKAQKAEDNALSTFLVHQTKMKAAIEATVAELDKYYKKIGKDTVKSIEVKNPTEEIDAERKRQMIDLQNKIDAANSAEYSIYDYQKQLNEVKRREEIANARETHADIAAIDAKYRELNAKLDQEYTQKKLSAAATLFEGISALAGKHTTLGKAAAVAQTLINTFASATKAVNDMLDMGGPWAIPAAIAAGVGIAAMGMANVKQILSVDTNFWEGGFTGPGGKYQPRGIVHAGEWVANADLVASPIFGPVIGALENERVNRMQGYANGGGPGITTSGSQGVTALTIGQDPEMKYLMRDIRSHLISLRRDGVNMKFGYRDADNVRKGISRLEDNESDVTM